MSADVEMIRQGLRKLAGQVLEGRWSTAPSWQGADVLISAEAPSPLPADAFYPPPRAVVTRHVAELSWLFERLRDAFMPALDGASKIEFFGRLANTANRYLATAEEKKQSVRDLLLSVLHEAHSVVDEMEEGTFHHLLVAPGGAIWDDLIERGEASGYLGPEETRRFFEELERRHR